MIVLFLAIALAIALVRPMRGSISALRASRFRFEWLIPAGLLIQTAVPWVLATATQASLRDLAVFSWLVGNGVLVIACLANWRQTGFRLVACGVVANAAVIVLNAGMPVSVAALEYLGVVSTEAQRASLTSLYLLEGSATRALILADILPVPGASVIRSVVSLGDLLLMVGVVVVVLDSSGALIRARRVGCE